MMFLLLNILCWVLCSVLLNVLDARKVRHKHLCTRTSQDDVIRWNHFLRYWPSVRGIHRSPVNSPHKGQWSGALMLSLICAWINSWVNNGEASDMRCHRALYDVIVMIWGGAYSKGLHICSEIWTTHEGNIRKITTLKTWPIELFLSWSFATTGCINPWTTLHLVDGIRIKIINRFFAYIRMEYMLWWAIIKIFRLKICLWCGIFILHSRLWSIVYSRYFRSIPFE